MNSESESILEELRRFVAERDWRPLHTPKNLSMALTIEAGELMEHFQWLTQEQSEKLDEATLREVADEVADVQIYLLMLADRLGIDIGAAVRQKIVKNALKYPVDG